MTKLICDSFGSKTPLHVNLKRLVGVGTWTLLNFEHWSFELINERAIKSRLCSLLGNKRIHLKFKKSRGYNEPDL